MSKLKTIEEHNKSIISSFGKPKNLTGVECPNCKDELQYTNIMYCSNPPQMDVKCYTCGYKDMLYV